MVNVHHFRALNPAIRRFYVIDDEEYGYRVYG
jgi:hypothetical protein